MTSSAPHVTKPTDADERAAPDRPRLIELSHPIADGMVTLPGLPGPEITTYLSREASRASYAPGTTFEIGRITMVANTGTYLDSPNHRFADGADLAAMPLERLVDLPVTVVRAPDGPGRAVGVESLRALSLRGRAVLLHTGDDSRFGTPEYLVSPGFLGRDGAEWLASSGAALVGIDAANIDDMGDPTRPAHTLLLAAGIPIVEHLTGLGAVPEDATFTAVPPRVIGLGTFPVRAFAKVLV